jgi:hypothetical protein
MITLAHRAKVFGHCIYIRQRPLGPCMDNFALSTQTDDAIIPLDEHDP